MKRNTISLETSILDLRLTFKEQRALELLKVSTVAEFLRMSVREVLTLRGYGQRTYSLLRRSQTKLQRKLGVELRDNVELAIQMNISVLPLSARAVKVLRRLDIHTVGEFLAANLSHSPDVPGCGAATYRDLLDQQAAVREQFAFVPEAFPRDDELTFEADISVLPLGPRGWKALRHLGIRTVGEFLALDLNELSDVRGCGPTTWHDLLSKQTAARARFAPEELRDLAARGRSPAALRFLEDRRAAAHNPVTPERLRLLPLFFGEPLDGVGPADLHESYAPHVPIKDLCFPTMVNRTLDKKEIEGLGQLLLSSWKDLIRLPCFGAAALEKTQADVRDFLGDRQGSSTLANVDYSSPEAFLLSLLTPVMAEKRQRRVLMKRLGGDGRVCTLAEIGQEHGLTRERIRQIENKAMRKLMTWRGRAALRPLHDFIAALVRQHGPRICCRFVCRALQEAHRWTSTLHPTAIEKLLPVFPDLPCAGDSFVCAEDSPCAACQTLAEPSGGG